MVSFSKSALVLIAILIATTTSQRISAEGVGSESVPVFSISEANKLIELPLNCVENQYPNKLNQTLAGDSDLLPPKALHPIFYGCFDWHSAVHGYWSIVTLLQRFPNLEKAAFAKSILQKSITAENVAIELAYFEKDINKSFERTYGWAWLLKLAAALDQWEDPIAAKLKQTLQPLSQHIAAKYISFLPKLVYPIRVGEHTNTAFGLAFAWDYAVSAENTELQKLVSQRAKDFYLKDRSCPITWEPSGFDFLSPCLEEIDIMRRILPGEEFLVWIDAYLPELKESDYKLAVGRVGDRSDGKLVHLDGLNFSRAWVLYGLSRQFSKYTHLESVANQHMIYSYPNLVGDSYEGGHWLASFAIYALSER